MEAKRSSELMAIADPKLRMRKEKEFGEQRKEAVARINKLQMRHDGEIKRLRKKHGILN